MLALSFIKKKLPKMRTFEFSRQKSNLFCFKVFEFSRQKMAKIEPCHV